MRIEDYDFWTIIESLGWGTKSTDYTALNKELKNSNYNLNVLYEIFAYYKTTLKHKISKWEDESGKSCGVGDDSFDDLTSHIIGLGRQAYLDAINNPEVAWHRARSKYGTPEGFKESFAYVFN